MLSEVTSRDADGQPGLRTTTSAFKIGERGRQARWKEGAQEGQLPRGKPRGAGTGGGPDPAKGTLKKTSVQ